MSLDSELERKRKEIARLRRIERAVRNLAYGWKCDAEEMTAGHLPTLTAEGGTVRGEDAQELLDILNAQGEPDSTEELAYALSVVTPALEALSNATLGKVLAAAREHGGY